MSGKENGFSRLLGSLLGRKVKEKAANAPGYNCGACGYESCAKMTEAVKQGETAWDKCTVLKLHR